MARTVATLIIAFLAFVLHAASAHAFVCLTNGSQCLHWSPGTATLKSFVVQGNVSFDQDVIEAANEWNAIGAAFHFTVQVGGQFFQPCGAAGPAHVCPNTGPLGDNPVMFASDFCGRDFGDIIELVHNCWDSQSAAMLNAPVFVNGNVPWAAYDGPIQCQNGQPLNDIRRVLTHEFGHVLGLDHSNGGGCDLPAIGIMNACETNIDRPQSDDIGGILSIYPNGSSAPSSNNNTTTGCQLGRRSRGAWWLALPVACALLGARFSRRQRSASCRSR